MTDDHTPIQALVFDYGGVLTPPINGFFTDLAHLAGATPEAFFAALGEAYAGGEDHGAIARLERGEITVADFEKELVRTLETRGGSLEPGALTRTLGEVFAAEGEMWLVVERAREAGLRTALLSNSWGTSVYPRERLDELFDVVVISGDVGLRKPERAIYELTLERLDLPPQACVFVDDFPVNIEVALDLGMRGVLHTDVLNTVTTIEAMVGIPLVHDLDLGNHQTKEASR